MVSRSTRPHHWSRSRWIWRRRTNHRASRNAIDSNRRRLVDVRVSRHRVLGNRDRGGVIHAKSAVALSAARMEVNGEGNGPTGDARFRFRRSAEALAVVGAVGDYFLKYFGRHF